MTYILDATIKPHNSLDFPPTEVGMFYDSIITSLCKKYLGVPVHTVTAPAEFMYVNNEPVPLEKWDISNIQALEVYNQLLEWHNDSDTLLELDIPANPIEGGSITVCNVNDTYYYIMVGEAGIYKFYFDTVTLKKLLDLC
jgi:hypothetical protein